MGCRGERSRLLGAPAPCHCGLADHVHRRAVEHRHRRTDHPGGHFHDLDAARPAELRRRSLADHTAEHRLRDGGRRSLGAARRGAEDLRRRERDFRRSGAQFRCLRAQPLAHLRSVETPRRGLDVRDGALCALPLAADDFCPVAAEPGGRGPCTVRHRRWSTCCCRGRTSACG